jgi:hypothetical protein
MNAMAIINQFKMCFAQRTNRGLNKFHDDDDDDL